MGRKYKGETRMVCNTCGLELPIYHFYMSTRLAKNGELVTEVNPRCRVCVWHQRKIREVEREREKKENERAKEMGQDNVITCKSNCAWYPCFQGIDSMSSNLALTCLKFKNKE